MTNSFKSLPISPLNAPSHTSGSNEALARQARESLASLKAARTVSASVNDDVGQREFEFNPADFSRVRQMILKHAGISLAESKQSMVYSRLARRLRATGKTRFSDYLDALGGREDPELEQFVNALTTNLTSFYREAHHFPMLAEHLLSLKQRSKIEVWCSAASTGEEPYTMAITACEAFNTLTPPVHILATDIDTRVLQTAREGVYKLESVEKIAPALLKRYFLKGSGAQEGYVRVRPELQQLITFRQLNLLDNQWPIRAGFDAIFCRNVMIYFEKDVQMQILQKFAPLMHDGGLLFAGHSENFAMARAYFKLRGKTVYEVVPEHSCDRKKSASEPGATRVGTSVLYRGGAA